MFNQIFVLDTRGVFSSHRLVDGRPMTGVGFSHMPALTVPLVIEPSKGLEVFILPPDHNARGFFTEHYCARYGTDIGLDAWLEKSGL